MVTASIEAYYKVETGYPPRATRFFPFPFVSFSSLFSTPAFLFFSFFPLTPPPLPPPYHSVSFHFIAVPPSLPSIFSSSHSPSSCIFSNFPLLYFPSLPRPNPLYTLAHLIRREFHLLLPRKHKFFREWGVEESSSIISDISLE